MHIIRPIILLILEHRELKLGLGAERNESYTAHIRKTLLLKPCGVIDSPTERLTYYYYFYSTVILHNLFINENTQCK